MDPEVIDALARLVEAAEGTKAEQPVADFVAVLTSPKLIVQASKPLKSPAQ